MGLLADDKVGGFFFLYGYGRTGKTFMWKTLSSGIISRRLTVLNVASSGIASWPKNNSFYLLYSIYNK